MMLAARAIEIVGGDWARLGQVGIVLRDDAGRAGRCCRRPAARLAAGHARQASVRASLRLSPGMAALHRHGRPRRAATARRCDERVVKALADIGGAPGGLLLLPRRAAAAGARRRAGTGREPPCPPASAAEAADRAIFEQRGFVARFRRAARRPAGRCGERSAACPPGSSAIDARLGRRAAAPLRPAGRPRRARAARRPRAGSTGRISTCSASPASRPRAISPRRAASRRWPTPSASTSSTAASPSSCTTSRIWSASSACVARNAERHADNPEFRADMIATLQSSVEQDERPARPPLATARRATSEPPRAGRDRAAASSAVAAADGAQPSGARCRRAPALVALADPAGARTGARPSRPECDRGEPAGDAGRDPRLREPAATSRSR